MISSSLEVAFRFAMVIFSTFVLMMGAQLAPAAGSPKQYNVGSCEINQICLSIGRYVVNNSKWRLCQSRARDILLFAHPSNDTMSVNRFDTYYKNSFFIDFGYWAPFWGKFFGNCALLNVQRV